MRCFFGFHKWSRWILAQYKTRHVRYGIIMSDWSEVTVQERTCELCGKVQTENL